MPELAGRVGDAFAARTRELEEHALSPLAVRSYETRGRERPEEECSVRTPFQRDRDRILHSKPFRRLKGKTQVFIDPAGDHYRTRMTHTLETSGIARVVARALRLNEDLTEAIGLGHDLGHPPFGHAGEAALDSLLERRDSATTSSPRRSRAGSTSRTRSSTASSPTPATAIPRRSRGRSSAIVDRVAYINHDIDDAIRYGILDEADLPRAEIETLGPTGAEADRHARPRPGRDLGARRRHRAERRDRRARCSRCAASCSSTSTSAPVTRARARARARDDPRGSTSIWPSAATTRRRSSSSSLG